MPDTPMPMAELLKNLPESGGLKSRVFAGSVTAFGLFFSTGVVVMEKDTWAGVACYAMAAACWLGFCFVNAVEKVADSKSFSSVVEPESVEVGKVVEVV